METCRWKNNVCRQVRILEWARPASHVTPAINPHKYHQSLYSWIIPSNHQYSAIDRPTIRYNQYAKNRLKIGEEECIVNKFWYFSWNHHQHHYHHHQHHYHHHQHQHHLNLDLFYRVVLTYSLYSLFYFYFSFMATFNDHRPL